MRRLFSVTEVCCAECGGTSCRNGQTVLADGGTTEEDSDDETASDSDDATETDPSEASKLNALDAKLRELEEEEFGEPLLTQAEWADVTTTQGKLAVVEKRINLLDRMITGDGILATDGGTPTGNVATPAENIPVTGVLATLEARARTGEAQADDDLAGIVRALTGQESAARRSGDTYDRPRGTAVRDSSATRRISTDGSPRFGRAGAGGAGTQAGRRRCRAP